MRRSREAGARARQRGADLGRVVAVVVDDHDAAGLAAHGEAAADAREAAERALVGGEGDAEEVGDREHASALSTLCCPGIASSTWPSVLPRATAVKRVRSPSKVTSTAR